VHPVRVVVVDDHEIVRAGIVALLAREADIHVVGVAATGEEGLRVIDEVEPDIAVLDYRLPGMSGVEVCEVLAARHPEVAVIVLTSYLDDEVVLRAVQAGARAYVYKDVQAAELKRAVRDVAGGRAVIDSAVTRKVLGWAHRQGHRQAADGLSLRETEVLRLVSRGASNKDIARELLLTENTVKTYLQRASEKLGCHSRSEAAAVATKRGLL
jgi:DNA-binding NarL/FixJ family response regulator